MQHNLINVLENDIEELEKQVEKLGGLIESSISAISVENLNLQDPTDITIKLWFNKIKKHFNLITNKISTNEIIELLKSKNKEISIYKQMNDVAHHVKGLIDSKNELHEKINERNSALKDSQSKYALESQINQVQKKPEVQLQATQPLQEQAKVTEQELPKQIQEDEAKGALQPLLTELKKRANEEKNRINKSVGEQAEAEGLENFFHNILVKDKEEVKKEQGSSELFKEIQALERQQKEEKNIRIKNLVKMDNEIVRDFVKVNQLRNPFLEDEEQTGLQHFFEKVLTKDQDAVNPKAEASLTLCAFVTGFFGIKEQESTASAFLNIGAFFVELFLPVKGVVPGLFNLFKPADKKIKSPKEAANVASEYQGYTPL
jgi:hypothetical protein